MSYTPSEGHGAKAEEAAAECPAARGPRALKTAESAGLLEREIEDLAQNSPLVPQADLGEAVPAHESCFCVLSCSVIDERNGSEGVPPQKRPAHFSNT